MPNFDVVIKIPARIEADDIHAARRYSNAVSFQVWDEKLPELINTVRESDDISGKRTITMTGETSITFIGLRPGKKG